MPTSSIRVPDDPHLRRWMLFVDGENFVIRAQDVAQSEKVSLLEGEYYLRNVFVWIPGVAATQNLTSTDGATMPLQRHAVRSHYYTSVQGDDQRVKSVREALWNLGFDASVFKKSAGHTKSKGVDIALTTEMLSNAFLDNYDAAVLITGDGDYVPLVSEVKRLGKVVYVSSFSKGLNPELRLCSDTFFEMDGAFLEQWQQFLGGSLPAVSGVTQAQ